MSSLKDAPTAPVAGVSPKVVVSASSVQRSSCPPWPVERTNAACGHAPDWSCPLSLGELAHVAAPCVAVSRREEPLERPGPSLSTSIRMTVLWPIPSSSLSWSSRSSSSMSPRSFFLDCTMPSLDPGTTAGLTRGNRSGRTGSLRRGAVGLNRNPRSRQWYALAVLPLPVRPTYY